MPTLIEKTLKKDGTGDYTTIAAFIAGEGKNLVTADEVIRLNIHKAGWDAVTPLTESFLDFAPFTTDATRRVELVVIAADKGNLTPDTTFCLTLTGSFGWVGRDKHVLFDGHEWANWTASKNHSYTNLIANEILNHDYTGETGIPYPATNCIAYNTAAISSIATAPFSEHIATNCTAILKSGFGAYGGTIAYYNSTTNDCLAFKEDLGGFGAYHLGSGDYNGVNAAGEGVPGVNSVITLTTADFEDYANDDYRIKATSPFATNSSTGSFMGAAIVSGGGGISVTVTETLNTFSDSSTVNVVNKVSLAVTETLSAFTESSIINVSAAVSIEATVTEVFNSFSDSSVITIVETGNVALNVTEILSPFSDSSALNVSANVNVNITEVLNSFLDGSNVTIAKDISIQVTEVLASFTDNSFVRMPTSWTDKAPVSTTYTIKPPVNTIWSDKG